MPETKRGREHERASLNWKDKSEILKACNGICSHCGKKITDDFTVEHMIPLSHGGDNSPENLAALCEACNIEKADRIVEPKDYYKHLPKKKLRAIQKKFDQFCNDRDWLTTHNLFRTDEFVIRADYKSIVNFGLNIMPTVFTVKKLTKQKTLEFMHSYLQKYGPGIATPDTIDAIACPYYEITQNGERLAVFGVSFTTMNEELTTSIQRLTGRDVSDLPWIAVTIIDLFSNPEIPQEKVSDTTSKLRYIMIDLLFEIGKTLSRKNRHDCLRMLWAARKTDEIAGPAINAQLRVGFKPHNEILARIANRPETEYTGFDVMLIDAVRKQRIEEEMTAATRRVYEKHGSLNDLCVETMHAYGRATKDSSRRLMAGDGYAKTPKKQKERERKTK